MKMKMILTLIIINSGYLDFLAVLCTCDGAGLPKNQNIICEKLLVENQSLLPQTKVNFLIFSFFFFIKKIKCSF
jgi:hypothetical protein